MPKPNPDQEKLDAAVKEALDTAADEFSELEAFSEELDPTVPLNVEGVKQLNGIIEGLSGALKAPEPESGKFNVVVSALSPNRNSEGGEDVSKRAKFLNCDQEQRDSVKRMFDSALATAKTSASEQKQGEEFDSTVRFTDGTVNESHVLTSALQINVFDNAISQAAAAVSQAAIEKIRGSTPPPPPV